MRVACVQMCSGVNIDANVAAAEALIRAAAADGAVFITTPEMTSILQRKPKNLFETITEENEDRCVAHFSSLAEELEIDLLIGSMAIKTGEKRAANRSFLFGPDGKIKARYDKIHLFDVSVSKAETWKESRVYDAGDKAVIAKTFSANVGLSVCYDLRFAKLYRLYAQAGAHIITVPAAFTQPTGRAHWQPLLRARAIETGAYILAPAQGGQHEDGRKTWGHSQIIDPWGEVIAELTHDDPCFIVAEIDLGKVEEARRRIPAWQHDPDFSL